MADFTSAQAQLAAARADQDAAQLAALQAAARARQAQAALDLATRQSSSAGDQKQKLAQLAAAVKQASADQAAANQVAARAARQCQSGDRRFRTVQHAAAKRRPAERQLAILALSGAHRDALPNGFPDSSTPNLPSPPAHELLVRIYPGRMLHRHIRTDAVAVRTHQHQSVLDEHLAGRWRGERPARRLEQSGCGAGIRPRRLAGRQFPATQSRR